MPNSFQSNCVSLHSYQHFIRFLCLCLFVLFHWSVFLSVPVPYYFSFVWDLILANVSPWTLYFFFNIVSAFLGPLHIHLNFIISNSFHIHEPAGSFIGIVLTPEISLRKNWCLYNIQISEHGISPSVIDVVFNFFQ